MTARTARILYVCAALVLTGAVLARSPELAVLGALTVAWVASLRALHRLETRHRWEER